MRSPRGRGVRSLPCIVLFLLGAFPALGAPTRSVVGPSFQVDVPALLHTAEAALGQQDFSTAVKALKSVVDAEPTLTAAWFNLGYAYSGLHENEQAVEAYLQALRLQPDLFEARLNLGILLIEMKKPQAALEHLEKAVTLKPRHPRAHLYYGRALGLVGRVDEAERQFQEVLRLDSGLAVAHFDLGQLDLGRKRYVEARAEFQKATQLDSRLAAAELGIALASENLNDVEGAVTHYEKYLAEKPDDLETRFHLARLYLQQAKNEPALESLQAVYQARPQMPGLSAALGDVCALLRKFPESERFYRQALIASPDQPDLHRALAQTLLDEEKFPEAEAEFRVTLKLDPRIREAAKGLATSVYLEKRYPEAVPLLEALARAPNPPAGIFFVLATCYDHLRDLPKALENYQHFLELSSGASPDQEWQARQRVKLLRREVGR